MVVGICMSYLREGKEGWERNTRENRLWIMLKISTDLLNLSNTVARRLVEGFYIKATANNISDVSLDPTAQEEIFMAKHGLIDFAIGDSH